MVLVRNRFRKKSVVIVKVVVNDIFYFNSLVFLILCYKLYKDVLVCNKQRNSKIKSWLLFLLFL